jgi:hypothetical protein
MKKTLKWTGITLVVLLVVSQAVRPARTNPPVDETKTMRANTNMSPEVAAIFERACSDCHSFNTTWPWYSQVAPASWLLVSHVDHARTSMSLSDWGSYDSKKKARKLQDICEQVEKGDMPLTSYLLLHPAAKLSDSDKQTLCDWTRQEGERVLASQ